MTSLDLALAYAEQLGFALLPLQARDKLPHFEVLKSVYGDTSWSRLQARPASPPEIREWLRLDPETNIGILTGEPSNHLNVLDIDSRPTIRLSETPMVETGRGMHVYLRGANPLASKTVDGFEIKADGNYVVAPPSIHPKGKRYQWTVAPTGLGNAFLPEADLADFDEFISQISTQLEPNIDREELPNREEAPYNTEVNLYTCETVIQEAVNDPGELEKWDSGEEFVNAFKNIVGIRNVPIEQTFRCILPGHTERRPSASLHREPRRGIIVYHDWHRGNQVYLLTEVYAAHISGRVRKLTRPQLAVWKRRLLVEAGFLTPLPIHLPPLPADAPPDAVTWYRGFRLLLACRREAWTAQGVPFTPSFAADWCRLPEDRASKAKGWIVRRGLIERVGRHGLMGLWLPAREPKPPRQTRKRA